MDTHLLTSQDWTNIGVLLKRYCESLEVRNHVILIGRLLRTSSLPETIERWLTGFSEQSNWEPVIAILLLLVPNLKVLNFGDHKWVLADGHMERDIIIRAGTLQRNFVPNTPWSIANLEEVTMACGMGATCLFMSILALPSLRRFSCNEWSGREEESFNRPWIDAPWGIQDLTLKGCSARQNELDKLLRYCVNLNRLYIERGRRAKTSSFSFLPLMATLSNFRNQMKDLTIIEPDNVNQSSMDLLTPTVSITIFKTLRLLDIEAKYILGRKVFATDSMTGPTRVFNFTDLPPSLEQLGLRTYYFTEIGEEQKHIKRELEANLPHLLNLPLLKKIQLHFTTTAKMDKEERLLWCRLSRMYHDHGVELSFFSRIFDAKNFNGFVNQVTEHSGLP